MPLGIWSHIINFGLGILMRIWNEERKASKEDREFQLAIAAQKMEWMDKARDRVTHSTFLQTMMMALVFVMLGVLVLFPLLAAFADIPLFILHEYVKETGILFWKSTVPIKEFLQVNGLYFPKEVSIILISATEFVFGAVVGGVGRR